MSETIAQSDCYIRLVIRGTLTNNEPLHIGDGRVTEWPGIRKKPGKPAYVRTVARDHEGRPFIPSTALRGPLRRLFTDSAIENDIFGFQDTLQKDEENAKAAGGILEVHDSLMPEHAAAPEFKHPPPFWRSERHTAVSSHVVLDRKLRTALDGRLFQREYVPPGHQFEVMLTAEEAPKSYLPLLLAAMERFNDPNHPLALGAETQDGWGTMAWNLDRISVMEASDVALWLENRLPECGYTACQRQLIVPALEIQTAAKTLWKPAMLHLDLTLGIQEGFLANDPSKRQDETQGSDNLPLRDPQTGGPLLPASGLRGALLSQAERIVRTIVDPDLAPAAGVDKAKSLDRIEDPGRPAKESEDFAKLDFLQWMFGGTGWQSPLRITPFRGTPKDDQPVTQERHAEDRFTAGVSGGAKFDISYFWQPMLKGRLSFELQRLQQTGLLLETIGMWVLLLRDLHEGDIVAGSKQNLGFGTCSGSLGITASLTGQAVPELADLYNTTLDLPTNHEFLMKCHKALLDFLELKNKASHA